MPPTLRAHIRDQLDRLPLEDAEMLRAASVAGRDFSVDTLAAALEHDRAAVAARCDELARRTRLIEQREDGHGFPHDLHREVLYELLAPDARARLHARVGAHLADSYGAAAAGMAAELGFHFVAGRDPERAVRFLHLAAERAFGRNAHAEGIRHLRAALDAAAGLEAGSERTRSEVELLSSLGQALVATGGWSAAEAEESLLRARALAARLSDNEPLVSVLLALATLYELRGEFGQANAMARECEELAPSGSAEHELESSELLACNLFHQGAFARALEYAERGVELFESGGAPGGYSTFPATLGDNAGVSCHDWAGLALWFLGKPDSALARATRALELARDPSRTYSLATARVQMAVVHQCRREPEAALEWAEATIAAAQQLGYVYREAMGRVLRGWAFAQLGDPHQGVREISSGLAASRGTGARMDDPHYLALLAEAQLRAGETDAGLAAIAAALELSRRERSWFYEPELHRLDGALHAAAGRADVAESCLRLGLARAREQGSKTLELRVATDLARHVADPAGAAEARATVAAMLAGFDEGRDTRDLRDAQARARDRPSRDRAGAGEHQHQRAERDAVGDEHRRRVVREPAQQERDRRVADDEGQERGEDRRPHARSVLVADLAQLEQARDHDRRHRQQERVARGRLAVEAEEEAGGDRRARARDAGHQRERLREADQDAVAAGDVLDRASRLRRPARPAAAPARARSASCRSGRGRARRSRSGRRRRGRRSRSGSCRG